MVENEQKLLLSEQPNPVSSAPQSPTKLNESQTLDFIQAMQRDTAKVRETQGVHTVKTSNIDELIREYNREPTITTDSQVQETMINTGDNLDVEQTNSFIKAMQRDTARVREAQGVRALQTTNIDELRAKHQASSSDSSSDLEDGDDPLGSATVQKILHQARDKKIRFGTQMKMKVYEMAGPVTLIELNEKMRQTNRDQQIEDAQQLLNFGEDFYDIKSELLLNSSYERISKQLYQSHGLLANPCQPTCISMHRFRSSAVMFLGNTNGYIRSFCMNSEIEKKPLFDSKVTGRAVICVDIQEDGRQLLAAYQGGMIVLWDLVKYKVALIIDGLTKEINRDEAGLLKRQNFSTVKILFADDKTYLGVAEECGRVRLIIVSRSLFGSYSFEVHSLYENAIKCAKTISAQRCEMTESSTCCQLAAFAGLNTIAFVKVRPFPPTEVLMFGKPKVCDQEDRVPTVAWGKGLTPLHPADSKHLAAVAWDNIVQLFSVEHDPQDGGSTTKLEASGYYCIDSKNQLDQVYFMGESVLVVFIDKKEFRVLDTGKFKLGHVEEIEVQQGRDLAMTRDFKAKVAETKVAELEAGNEITGFMARDNMRKTEVNTNNTMCKYKKTILMIGESKILEARLLSWSEFLNKIHIQDNQNWITILKVAVKIFNGEIRGLAQLPDSLEKRQEIVRPYIRKLLMIAIQKATKNYTPNQKAKAGKGSNSSIHYRYCGEEIAIRIAIEFCLQTQDPDFFFNEVYKHFCSVGLELSLLRAIWSILTVKPIKMAIPPDILQKIFHQFERQEDYEGLEKLIVNIKLEAYQKTCEHTAHSMRSYLEKISRKHHLVVALMQLRTSDQGNNAIQGCKDILKMLLDQIKSRQARENTDSESSIKVTTKDLQMMRNADEARKSQIQRSSFYLKYRMLWIIGIYLNGKKFPTGVLTQSQHRAHVHDIVDFMTEKKTLELMLDFDPQTFFETLTKLFQGPSWRVLTQQSYDYVFGFQKQGTVQAVQGQAIAQKNRNAIGGRVKDIFSTSTIQGGAEASNQDKQQLLRTATRIVCDTDTQICTNPVVNSILYIFKQAVTDQDRASALTCFLELLLSIIVAHSNEQQSRTRSDLSYYSLTQQQDELSDEDETEEEKVKRSNAHIVINYCWIETAIKTVLLGKQGKKETLERIIEKHQEATKNEINQSLLIETIRAVKLKNRHLQQILELIGPKNNSLAGVKVALYTNQMDYVQAFMVQLYDHQLKKGIFKWLQLTLTFLQQEDDRIRRQKNVPTFDPSQSFVDGDGSTSWGDLSDDDDESLDAQFAQSRHRGGKQERIQHAPYQQLRDQIKHRILKLAEIDSKSTVQMVQKHFKAFEEELVMVKFTHKYEEEQYNFLKYYIETNRDEMSQILQETGVDNIHTKKATKYQKYIVLFTKLLCKLHKPNIEEWVSQTFFPAEQCLKVCREYNAIRGIAVLTKRCGKMLDAIQAYMQILGQLPLNKLVEEIVLVYRHNKPNFLPEIQIDDAEGTISIVEPKADAKPANPLETEFVSEVDKFLGDACRICIFDDLDQEQRHKGWFIILRGLQKVKEDAYQRSITAIRMAEQAVCGKVEYATLQASDRQKYIEAIESFMLARINYILLFPKLDIPLSAIMQKLRLNYHQIKNLCAVKLRHNETVLRIEKCQQKVVQGQLFDMMKGHFTKMSMGYTLEQEKRYVTKHVKGEAAPIKVLKGNTICNASFCLDDIVNPELEETVFIYECAHQFHAHCLKRLQQETQSKQCPLCLQNSYLSVREQNQKIERRLRKAEPSQIKRSRQYYSDEEEEDDGDSSGESDSERYNNFQMEEEDPASIKLGLQRRIFEKFDQLLDDESLVLTEFNEMIMDDD